MIDTVLVKTSRIVSSCIKSLIYTELLPQIMHDIQYSCLVKIVLSHMTNEV